MQWLSLGYELIACYLWTLRNGTSPKMHFSLALPFLTFLSKSSSSFPFLLFFLPHSDISSLFHFLLFHYHPWNLVIICKQKGGERFHFCAVAQRQGMAIFTVVLWLAWETPCILLQLRGSILIGKLKLLHRNFWSPDKISKECRRNALGEVWFSVVFLNQVKFCVLTSHPNVYSQTHSVFFMEKFLKRILV